jgi:hypothetical protein
MKVLVKLGVLLGAYYFGYNVGYAEGVKNVTEAIRVNVLGIRDDVVDMDESVVPLFEATQTA